MKYTAQDDTKGEHTKHFKRRLTHGVVLIIMA